MDGTTYEMDALGRTTKMIDPTGLNEVKFNYYAQRLDYIEDSMGRKIKFDYDFDRIWPRINKIWVENDSYNREINYTIDDTLLKQAKDAGGRISTYDYDFRLMYGGEAGATLNIATIIAKIVAGPIAGLAGSIFGFDDVTLYGNLQAQVVLPMNEMKAPGQGVTKIGYDKKTYMYGNCDLNWLLVVPISATLSLNLEERLLANQVEVFLDSESSALRTTTFDYNLEYYKQGQPFIDQTIEDDGRQKTVYHYKPVEKKRYRWEDRSVSDGNNLITFPMLLWKYHYLPISDFTEVYDKKTGNLLEKYEYQYNIETMRPTQNIVRRGENYRSLDYTYDNWGNVTYIKDYSMSNGRSNQSENWMYYLNTDSIKVSEAPWKYSPYIQSNVNKDIHNLVVGTVTANHVPTETAEETIKYLHTYNEYSSLGQLTGTARWNGIEWVKTQFEYYPEDGSLKSKITPEGHQTVYEYDQYGLLSKITEKAVEDAQGVTTDIITTMGYDHISGWKLWEKNPRGYVTQYEYDSLGRTKKIIAPDDDDESWWTPDDGLALFRNNNPVTVNDFDDVNLDSLLTDPLGNQTKYDFDELGRLAKLIKYQRKDGQYIEAAVTTLKYDAWGNINEITDPNGNGAGPIWRYTTVYEYDAMGRNSAIIYPDETEILDDNPRVVLNYDYSKNILDITDERGHKTKEYYDMQDRVVRQIRYKGAQEIETKHYFDGLGNEIITIDPKGSKVIQEYNDLNLVERINLPTETFWENDYPVTVTPYQRFVYNKAGQKIKDIVSLPGDSEHETIYEPDGLGRIIKTTTTYTDVDGLQKEAVSEAYYDENGNAVRVVDANNTSLPFNEQKALSYTYSAVDLVLTETDQAGNTTSYTYDAAGNRTSMTDPRGNSEKYSGDFTIDYDYDDLNRLVKGHLPAAPGELIRPVVELIYDASGNLKERIEPDGGKTSYTYYPRNLVEAVSVEGEGKTYTTTYYYDNAGNEEYVKDTKGNTTTKEYDELNRLAKIIYPEGNYEQFEYDVNNNRTAYVDGKGNRTEYDYNKYNHLVKVRDAKGEITNYHYDRLGNMTQKINALNHLTKYKYDELNRLLLETDPQGHVTKFGYDAVGNQNFGKDAKGTISDYKYYPNNLLEKITLTNGDIVKEIAYEYDEAGYLTRAQDGGVVTEYNTFDSVYEPDPFGRIHKATKYIDGKSFTVEYKYDVMGRVSGVKSPTGRWVEYQYDKLGQLIGVPGYINEKPNYDTGGFLKGITAANGVTTSFDYDKNGRLTNLGYNNQTDTLKAYSLKYDEANNISFKNDNEYQYDALNQLVFADLKGKFENNPSDGDQKVARTLSDYSGQKPLELLAAQSEIIELDYAAGSIGVDLYDQVTVSRIELSPQSPIHRVNAGNIALYYSLDNIDYIKIEDWEFGIGSRGEIKILLKTPVTARYIKVKSFFDERSKENFEPVNNAEFVNITAEIIRVFYYETTRVENYTYDAVGNRETETIVQGSSVPIARTYSYYLNSNLLKENGKYAFAYDANGNLVKKGRSYTVSGNNVTFNPDQGEYWEYEYDLLNRLTKVMKNGKVVAEYVYDDSGLRIKKSGSGIDTYYVFGVTGEVLYEEENREYMEYVYVLGKHFARVDGDLDTDERQTYFYHTDHLGSAVLVTDEVGNTVWSTEYTPFGRIGMEEGILNKAAKFTGKDLDEDTGLYYYNARWYDQEIGRFVTEDTYKGDITRPQTLNFYNYVLGNPLKYVDPTGHHTEAYWRNWGTQYSIKTEEIIPTEFVEYAEKKEDSLAKIPSEFALLAASVACEPLDWGVTFYSWLQGDFSGYDIIGLFPGINNQMAKKIGNGVEAGIDFLRNGKKVKTVFDSANDAVKIANSSEPMFKMNLQLFAKKGKKLDGLSSLGKGIVNLSKDNKKHILNRHTFNRVKQQLCHKIGKVSRSKIAQDIAERGFFNPKWTEDMITEVSETAYNQLLKQGNTNGRYVVEALGEEITVAIEDGVFKTAWGHHKFTLDDFGY